MFIGITLPQLIVYNVFQNYSAKNQGKGAVGGVGGIIKQVATQAVVTRKAGLEKLRAHSCACTYHAHKSSLMYTKKRVCKLFLS